MVNLTLQELRTISSKLGQKSKCFNNHHKTHTVVRMPFPCSAFNNDRTLKKQTLTSVYTAVSGKNAGEKCVANMWFGY